MVKTTESFSKWKIGFSVAPNYSKIHDVNVGGDARTDRAIAARKEAFTGRFGFEIGVQSEYAISEKIGFSFGLRTQRFGNVLKEIPYYNIANPENPSYDPNDPSFGDGTLKNRYSSWHVSLPALINISTKSKSTRLLVSTDIITSVLLTAKSTSIITDKNGKKTKSSIKSIGNLRRVNVAPTVGIGVEHEFSEKLTFRWLPTFQYQILGRAKKTNSPLTIDIRQHFWSVDMGFALYYKL